MSGFENWVREHLPTYRSLEDKLEYSRQLWDEATRQAQEPMAFGNPSEGEIKHGGLHLSYSGKTIGRFVCDCGYVLGDLALDEIDKVFSEHVSSAKCSDCEHERQTVNQAVAETIERCAQELVDGVFVQDGIALEACKMKAARLRAMSPDPGWLAKYVELKELEARQKEAEWWEHLAADAHLEADRTNTLCIYCEHQADLQRQIEALKTKEATVGLAKLNKSEGGKK